MEASKPSREREQPSESRRPPQRKLTTWRKHKGSCFGERALRWALGPSLGNILLLGVYQPETDFWAHQSVPTRLRDRPPSQPPALALMEVMQAPATLTSLADRGEAALALLDGACRSQEMTPNQTLLIVPNA